MSTVSARLEPLVIPTYPVGAPEKNPVFFEKRVYQGSKGKVYPVPFIDKVYDEAKPMRYSSAVLENEHVRLVLLPEIGGRILIGQDKNNKDYDFFYRQDVIKPALVGLAGPWISGGVEFNWPQHHRPGTFMPADVFIEEEKDGARTVWMSEHDPLNRLKGMHGLRLRPGSSLIELRARLYNRTPHTQTFLWWANVAAKVHDQYQSFFPPDVHYVADHAVRAMSSFPEARNPYYGVNYKERAGANDLSWYKNIPVPTSYMICETNFDFFGGYDHAARGGFIHVADRHIAPGKKQWTWGNHEFGWAWDRELTDEGGPYIELMAGVYTDNQPDFSYLHPYETRTFSQFWWPIQDCGPVQNASKDAALRLVVETERLIDAAVLVSKLTKATVLIKEGSRTLWRSREMLAPGKPWKSKDLRMRGDSPEALEIKLLDSKGQVLLSYRPRPVPTERSRSVATEPPAPSSISSQEELYLTGEHLEQYRHPTRSPEAYWNELLARDPNDSRAHIALGRQALRKGCAESAKQHFEKAVARLTLRHPNPETGEAHYLLGLALRQLAEANALPQNQARHSVYSQQAYATFAKAAWNHAWRNAASYQLACLDAQGGNFTGALERLDEALACNPRHNQAQVLKAALLRRLRQKSAAKKLLSTLLQVDPLDHWARHEEALLTGDHTRFLELSRNDAQTILDLVFDYCDAGLFTEALELITLHEVSPKAEAAVPNPLGKTVMTSYAKAWILARLGREQEGSALLSSLRTACPDYFFPSRVSELLILSWALSLDNTDPVAGFGLGNQLYDLRRHEDAITAWERPAAAGLAHATTHRNLGIALWNVRRDGPSARKAYERAIALAPQDARLASEFDQLRKKLNEPLAARLETLLAARELVLQRDDASVELASLYNLLGRPTEALNLLLSRRFHPWEGGEGSVLRQYTTARLALGRQALAQGNATEALSQFELAMKTPDNLGEAYHFLQAKADVNYFLGLALRSLGREDEARHHFEASAGEAGDFAEMAVTAHSPLSYHRGLSLRALGRENEARAVFESLLAFAQERIGKPATIDYFATSLPNLLVFEEDLSARKDAENHLLAAFAQAGLGNKTASREHLNKVLAFNVADQKAQDLSRELAD